MTDLQPRSHVSAAASGHRAGGPTLGLLTAGLLLSIGTPVYLGLARGLRGYLFHPALFAAQTVPFVLAAALWLPCRKPPAIRAGRWLSAVLFLAAAALYVPMLTGWTSSGGDMIGLAFIAIDAAMTLAVLLWTGIAQGVIYLGRRRRRR